MLNTLAAFLGAAFLIAMVPGPSTVVIVQRAAKQGRRAGLATVLGNETGVLAWGLAAALGLSALLIASRVAYDGLRIVGAAVLVWFGLRALWQSRRRTTTETAETGETAAADASDADAGGSGNAAPTGVGRCYRQGVVTSFANPKAGVFAVSFLPQFVPHGVPVPLALIALSALWALVDLVWYTPIVWLAGGAGRVLRRPRVRRTLERVSGIVLLGFGLRLATDSA
ncbi:LysE family translocator [Actinomadura rupiterrae]|uniref:LysE family translocator n=1 Tax=Actinomadura rupiterrae TaxID=559627 RepID=UPI0020A5EBF9|nr:LysE family translocator [Actinomadura rupiterrae]MCP2343293.1 threonine/homoserine/homoserine lactone efflux protein [Actinomadura rupiterrae]